MVASWDNFACACKTWTCECLCSIKSNCAITFDRIIFIRGFRRNRRRLQSPRRPLIRPRLSRNSLDFRLIYCRHLRLPAASFCASFDGFGTTLWPAKDKRKDNWLLTFSWRKGWNYGNMLIHNKKFQQSSQIIKNLCFLVAWDGNFNSIYLNKSSSGMEWHETLQFMHRKSISVGGLLSHSPYRFYLLFRVLCFICKTAHSSSIANYNLCF